MFRIATEDNLNGVFLLKQVGAANVYVCKVLTGDLTDPSDNRSHSVST